MAITGRVPLLLLLGVVAVVLRPASARCGCGCSWSACSSPSTWPRARAPRHSTSYDGRRGGAGRPGRPEHRSTWPTPADAAMHLLVRDAWQPSAGARDNRHRIRLGPGSGQAADDLAAAGPPRRAACGGGHAAHGRAARARGAAGARATSRARSGRCRRSSRASTCPRGWPGCGSWTAGRRCGCAGRAPSSTRCASTSAGTTCARSTGGPPLAPATWSSGPGSPSATAGS